jgi:cytochrome oxidase Cu insertion factor (SCO1/SenC/PrrC family)
MRIIAILSTIVLMAPPADAQSRRMPVEGKLKVGDAAPDISAADLHSDKSIRLTDLRGKPTVLIFGSCT